MLQQPYVYTHYALANVMCSVRYAVGAELLCTWPLPYRFSKIILQGVTDTAAVYKKLIALLHIRLRQPISLSHVVLKGDTPYRIKSET